MKHYLGLKTLGIFDKLRLKIALWIAPADVVLLPMTKDLYERAGEILELAVCQQKKENRGPCKQGSERPHLLVLSNPNPKFQTTQEKKDGN